jgi:peroxiredoxin
MNSVWFASYLALWVVVVVLSVMVILLYRQLGEMYLGTREGRSRDGLRLGARVPGFSLLNQHGATVTLPQRKPSIIVFGSPSCGPCTKLMPELVNFYHEVQGRIYVAFVSSADPEANQKFASENAAEFDVLTEQRVALLGAYKVRSTPFAFYLDHDGIVRSKGIVNRNSQIRALVVRGGGLADVSVSTLNPEPLPLQGVRQ